jgi:hypothetical protein
MRTACHTFVAIFVVGIAALSQNAPSKPSFEVATVKQNAALQGGSRLGGQPGGRFVATRVTLRTLIGASGLAGNAQTAWRPRLDRFRSLGCRSEGA